MAQNLSQKAPHNRKNTQTRIRSDIIDIKQKSKKIDFINNVIVEKDDVSLLADKMTVFYKDKNSEKINKTDSSNIKEIKAFGAVKLFNNEFTASSDFATFDPNQNIFILEQNVIVNNGTSVLNGEKFLYDLNTKKGKIIGQKAQQNINKNNSNDNAPNVDNRVTVIIGDDIKEQKKLIKKD